MDREELEYLTNVVFCKAELVNRMSKQLCNGLYYDYSYGCKMNNREEIEREILMRYSQNKLFVEVLEDIAETLLEGAKALSELVDKAGWEQLKTIKVGNAA